MQAILDCAAASWQPGIGDPSVMGWVTVAVYAAAALLAALVARRAPFPARSRGRERTFWILAALVLAFLAVNKELDLQSALTALGRCDARLQGWYDARRAVQESFIWGLIVAAAAVLLGLLVWLRRTWSRTALPLFGLVFVAGFVLVRAVGFHHMDRLIDTRVILGDLPLRANWLLELPGPLLIAAAAAILLARRQRGRA